MKPIDLTIGDYHDVVQSFHAESDRSAAVLAGSYLENYLGIYLKFRMAANDRAKYLFERGGALADFQQRIECAYAFGIISVTGRKDLDTVRKIRNHFAHHPKILTFNEDLIKSLVNELSLPSALHMPDGQYLQYTDRQRYLMTISSFIGSAHNDMVLQRQVP